MKTFHIIAKNILRNSTICVHEALHGVSMSELYTQPIYVLITVKHQTISSKKES